MRLRFDSLSSKVARAKGSCVSLVWGTKYAWPTYSVHRLAQTLGLQRRVAERLPAVLRVAVQIDAATCGGPRLSGDMELALTDRTYSVERDMFDVPARLARPSTLDEDPGLRAHAGTDHDHGGRAQSERAQAGHNIRRRRCRAGDRWQASRRRACGGTREVRRQQGQPGRAMSRRRTVRECRYQRPGG